MWKQESSKRSLRPLVLVPVLLLAAGGFAICHDGVDDATLSASSFTIRRFDRQAFSDQQRVENLKFGALGDDTMISLRMAPGRFGWKANVPSLKQQIAAAALGDMGEGLADGRPDFKAGPRDWRTPALWGLGLSQTVSGSTAMLHDGRARNVIEAIFWHGGEAERAREAFRNMSKADREALVRFVEAI